MPNLDVLSRSEAQLQSASGPRAALMREYIAFIERVPSGEAGRLTPSVDESLAAVRRRLNAAAKYIGKEITIKRTEDAIYFWHGVIKRRRRKTADTPE